MFVQNATASTDTAIEYPDDEQFPSEVRFEISFPIRRPWKGVEKLRGRGSTKECSRPDLGSGSRCKFLYTVTDERMENADYGKVIGQQTVSRYLKYGRPVEGFIIDSKVFLRSPYDSEDETS